MKKSALVWFILCGLFVIGSVTFIPKGEWVYFIGGLVIAAVFGFLGIRAKNKPAPAPEAAPVKPAANSEFEHKTLKLSGVSFKNDDGTPRQGILRKMKFGDPPFDGETELELSRYEYEGKPALAVLANGLQIGNIPAADVPYIIENWDRLLCFSGCHVYGGGKGEGGDSLNFGCEVVLRFRKSA